MRKPAILPDVGAESVVLSVWFADAGDHVYAGDRLVEVLAGGATFDVAAPATGRLVEKLAWPEDRLHAGQVLGMVEEDDGVTG
jgi:pyruvate/2-oxoglutarate dehydrogenase complex dihydrolipoamide acyltransferase (E2) component